MKLLAAMELGIACGLTTIDECVYNVELHAMQLFCYTNVEDELKELTTEASTHTKGEKIPADIVERVNKELDSISPPSESSTFFESTP